MQLLTDDALAARSSTTIKRHFLSNDPFSPPGGSAMGNRLRISMLAALGWAVVSGIANAQTTTVTVNVNITSPNPVNPRGAGYNAAIVTIPATTGQSLDIRAAVAMLPAFATDTYIYLINPAGTVVAQNDDNGLGLGNPFGSQVVHTATMTGNYTLVVTTFGPGQSYMNVPVSYPGVAAPPPPPPPVPPPLPPSGIPNV
jgi:hypothetical protein